jgi:hypothetical protein
MSDDNLKSKAHGAQIFGDTEMGRSLTLIMDVSNVFGKEGSDDTDTTLDALGTPHDVRVLATVAEAFAEFEA